MYARRSFKNAYARLHILSPRKQSHEVSVPVLIVNLNCVYNPLWAPWLVRVHWVARRSRRDTKDPMSVIAPSPRGLRIT